MMDNHTTYETVRNLEALVATLNELVDVQEKVVGEQSDRIMQDEMELKKSNDRFIAFIKEAAMRLKNPIEVVEENLTIVVKDIEDGESEPGSMSLPLRIQIKNLEQIRRNIIELNKAIVDRSGDISESSKKFLTE
jgi:light-regulated signal transduction histidine kinase (bacteriophytochrome)